MIILLARWPLSQSVKCLLLCSTEGKKNIYLNFFYRKVALCNQKKCILCYKKYQSWCLHVCPKLLKTLEAGSGLFTIDKICRSKHHFSIHEGEMVLCSRSGLYVPAHSESCWETLWGISVEKPFKAHFLWKLWNANSLFCKHLIDRHHLMLSSMFSDAWCEAAALRSGQGTGFKCYCF